MSRDYSEISIDELEIIVRDGLKSEFWQWFTYNFEEDQKLILDRLLDLKMTNWDDVVKVVNLIATYKTRNEMVTAPWAIIRDLDMRRKLNSP